MARPDPLAQFRDLLETDAANRPAAPSLGGGGGFRNTPGGGGGFGGGGYGGGGGMDPWQTSVENRLGALESRLGGIDTKLGKVCEDVSTLKERVSHLPTKTWLGVAAVGIIGALTAAIGYGEKIQTLFGQNEPPAISSPAQTDN